VLKAAGVAVDGTRGAGGAEVSRLSGLAEGVGRGSGSGCMLRTAEDFWMKLGLFARAVRNQSKTLNVFGQWNVGQVTPPERFIIDRSRTGPAFMVYAQNRLRV